MMITNSNPKNLNNSSSENFKSEFLPVVERVCVCLLNGNFAGAKHCEPVGFDKNRFYNLVNEKSLCKIA